MGISVLIHDVKVWHETVRVVTGLTDWLFVIVAQDVDEDFCCDKTSLRASGKEMFWLTLTLQISASRIHIGHCLDDAIWEPLQFLQEGGFEQSDPSCSSLPQRWHACALVHFMAPWPYRWHL
jgi:hypothetical protein